MPTRLLIIEDDPALCQMLSMHFEDAGFDVVTAGDCAHGLRNVERGGIALALLDQQLPDGEGSLLLPRLLAADPDLTVVMMTGRHDLELAIDAIQQGAADFVHKPVQPEELTATVNRLLENRRLSRVAESPPVDLDPAVRRDLIGRSDAMLKVSKEIALSARGQATVLITGESGTGKEVVARLIHQHSGVAGPFVAVNCAAIVDTLLESELFGHERGAFTGAQARKAGKLELADHGTIFLDEVGELAPGVQAKLLRVLQERTFERVGGNDTLSSTARVVAATNRDLMAEAAAGRFREDLAYRLRVIEIRVPPLRERIDDVRLLAKGLLIRIAERIGQPRVAIADSALERLEGYDWPGNVRELENLLTKAAVHSRDGIITTDLLDLPASHPCHVPASSDGRGASVLRSLDEVEAEHIQRVLDQTGGHKGRSSEVLGISRPALDRKIAKYGLLINKPRV